MYYGRDYCASTHLIDKYGYEGTAISLCTYVCPQFFLALFIPSRQGHKVNKKQLKDEIMYVHMFRLDLN